MKPAYQNTAVWDSWEVDLTALKALLSQKDLAKREVKASLREKLAQVVVAEKPLAPGQNCSEKPRQNSLRPRLFYSMDFMKSASLPIDAINFCFYEETYCKMGNTLIANPTQQELVALLERINTELASVKAELAYQKFIIRRMLSGCQV